MDLARNLKIDSVSRLNPRSPLQLRPNQTVGEAVKLMRQKGAGCILIGDGEPAEGLFTERDLIHRFLQNGNPLPPPVPECMTPHPVVIHPTLPTAPPPPRHH